MSMEETKRIARDMDEGAVRIAVRIMMAQGVEVTVMAVSKETGISTSRVEPHMRAMASEV